MLLIKSERYRKKSKKAKKNLKSSLCTPDHFCIPANRKRLPKRNPERFENCFALVVIVLTGKRDMCSDTGPGNQTIKEMLKDIDRNSPDSPVPEPSGKDKVSPAPAVERHGCQ
jgi:hypothetical protein